MNSGVSISAMTDADLAARVFVDYYGVPEDPATGSGNGCLAGYQARYDYLRTNMSEVRSL